MSVRLERGIVVLARGTLLWSVALTGLALALSGRAAAAADAPAASPAAAENLVRNGGFEEGHAGWEVKRAAVTDREAHTGKCALYVNPAADPPAASTYGYQRAFFQTPALVSGRFYRADAWVKARGFAGDREKALSLYTDDGGSVFTNPGNHDWEPLTHVFQARRDGSARLYLMCPEQTVGEYLVDDVRLRECPDPGLTAAGFEDGTLCGAALYGGEPLPVARVVQGATPGGTRYLDLGRGSIGFRPAKPGESGDVEFSFLVRTTRRATVDVAGIRLELPLITIRPAQGPALGLGLMNPGTWYRFRGVIHLATQTYDLAVTDFADPLGSFARTALQPPSPIKSISGLWVNAEPDSGTAVDDLYVGPVQAGN